MSGALDRATQEVSEEDLSGMVLDGPDLPGELQGFALAREGVLDNATMAEQGFPGSTTGETAATGRLAGYLREFAGPHEPGVFEEGFDLLSATVVHLFGNGNEVSRWMNEKFLGEFQRFTGRELGEGQQLLSADQIHYDGFSDEAVGLRTVQPTQAGPVSSTIVDFRVGWLLGVAYLVTLGDVERVTSRQVV